MTRWWLEKPYRLIQTNLREIDVRTDVEQFVDSLRDYSADILLLNTGGIVANYPTQLEYHYRNPHLVNDFVGEVTRLCKQHNIRVIARFDFSRLNETIALDHPEWLYHNIHDEIVNYNGQVHTCLNGYYQQQYSIEIMTEAARRYDIDGVFINMHGYVLRDYSWRYQGICQCNNCRQRFRDMYGHHALPKAEDASDPLYRDYNRFREETVEELFLRRSQAIKNVRPDIALNTYTPEGTDIYRIESNTKIDDKRPEFNYAASHHAKSVLHTWPDKAMSGSAVHFVDYAMRHSSVSPHHTAVRVAQTIVQGAWPDYYVIGHLLNQEDRLGMDIVRELFGYHKQNESYYMNNESVADVCLIHPQGSAMYGSKTEYQGIYRMLAEQHILFDVLADHVLETDDAPERLRRYRLLIMPETRNMGDAACRHVDEWVRSGGKLLATGAVSTCDRKGTPLERFRLAALGVDAIKQSLPQQQGTYFQIGVEDKQILSGLDELDLVYLYGEYLKCAPRPDCRPLMKYVPPCMFGPPEKCYYTEVTEDPGMLHHSYGEGQSVLIPWGIGMHYERLSNHGHAKLFMAALRDILGLHQRWETDTSPLVEITAHYNYKHQADLLHAVNLSGQLGTSFHAPLPIRDIQLVLRPGDGIRHNRSIGENHQQSALKRRIRTVKSLTSKRAVPYEQHEDGTIRITLPELELFDTIAVEYEQDGQADLSGGRTDR